MKRYVCVSLAMVCSASTVLAEEVKIIDKSVQITKKDGQISATISIGDYQTTRHLTDFNNDGWDDLWCDMYKKEVRHRNKRVDTDGDGLTDYEEMLLWRNPMVKVPFPKALTKAEIAKSKTLAEAQEKRRFAKMAEIKEQVAPFVIKGKKKADGTALTRKDKALSHKLKLESLFAKRKAKQLQKEIRIQAYLRKVGGSREYADAQGNRRLLRDIQDGVPQVFQSHNFRAADTISTDELLAPISGQGGSTGLNLTGSGYVMGLWDEGDVLLGHTEFSGRVTDKDGTTSLNLHSTHVAGTMMARGAASTARGMSPQGQLHANDFTDDAMEMASAVINDNLKLSNHSYGFIRGWDRGMFNGQLSWIWWGDIAVSQDEDYFFGFYDSSAKGADEIVYDAQTYLPVWSAGNERGSITPTTPNVLHWTLNNGVWQQVSFTPHPNDQNQPVNPGYDLIANYSVAKNVLTVGAVNDIIGGYSTSAGVTPSTFTSYGPVDDGRIKPDVTANGVDVTSTLQNGGYGVLSGTSMSAPSVTGSINLLRERYDDLELGDSNAVLASSWKALVIHTTDEAGPNTGPDYMHGWGLVNTLSAAELLDEQEDSGSALTYIKEINLQSGDFVEFEVTATGGQPIKATCVYTDPEGIVPPPALDANVPAIVNDLDLRIFDSSNNESFPWKLNPANPTAAATNNSDNNRDNVEQVIVSNPTAGATYTVRVNHKGDLVDDSGQVSEQALSLIVSGVDISPLPRFQIREILATDANEYTLFWNSVVGGLYNIESSPDLITWTTVEEDISATKDLSAYAGATSGATKLFWRVKRTR